jgi:4-amino-4-deoxy-L-arabinose transferase-like glycosyltransferase
MVGAGRCAGLIAIVGLAWLLRLLYLGQDYSHPDEPIAVRVVRYMHQSGDWDTNWRKAELPPMFKYDQYNFSSYLYAALLFAEAVGSFEVWTLRLFSAICAGLTVFVLALVAWKSRRVLILFTATLLTALAPILVQDAHYARPEAFTALLTMLVVWLCWPRETAPVWRALLAALLVGVVCACKVSQVFFAWMPLLPLVDAWGKSGPRRGWRLALGIAGVGLMLCVGFVATVPGVVRHPDVWLHGLAVLKQQYSSFHPGQSHPGGTPVGDLLFRYFGATLGWTTMALFLLGGLAQLRRRAWHTLLLVWLPVLVFFAYFAIGPVFFERNLSHVIPLYLLGAGYGTAALYACAERWLTDRRLTLRLVVGLLLVAQAAAPAHWSRRLVFRVFSRDDARARADYGAQVAAAHPTPAAVEAYLACLYTDEIDQAVHAGRVPVRVCLWDIGDETSAANLRRFLATYNATPIGYFRGAFSRLPPCTLQAYGSWMQHYYLARGPVAATGQ